MDRISVSSIESVISQKILQYGLLYFVQTVAKLLRKITFRGSSINILLDHASDVKEIEISP